MSWPFRKRLSRPSLLPISGPWTIGEGEYSGNVMLVRLLYTRAPQNVQKQLERLRETITSHEIQLMIQPDKDWEVYAQLVPA